MGQSAIVKSGTSDNKLKSLESYASYEEGGQEGNTFIQIPIPIPVPTSSPGAEQESGGGDMGGGSKAPSPFMSLYRGDG